MSTINIREIIDSLKEEKKREIIEKIEQNCKKFNSFPYNLRQKEQFLKSIFMEYDRYLTDSQLNKIKLMIKTLSTKKKVKPDDVLDIEI